MSIEVYSNGSRVVGIESVIGYDLENPMGWWNECSDHPVYVLSKLWEFTYKQEHAYTDVRELIEDQDNFDGDTYCMSDEHVRRYIDKHFFSVPFSKGEHGLSWYSVGSSIGWDCCTAGFFLLPRGSWSATDANSYTVDCNTLMRCMTAWANGDEYAVHEFYISDGSLDDETCYGFYGEEDAISDACIDGYSYIGAFEHDSEEEIQDALAIAFPDKFRYIEHVEHIPEQVKIIPAHDEIRTEFIRL